MLGALPAFGWNNIVLNKKKFEGCYYIDITASSYILFLFFGIMIPCSIILVYLYVRIYRISKAVSEFKIACYSIYVKIFKLFQHQIYTAIPSSRENSTSTSTENSTLIRHKSISNVPDSKCTGRMLFITVAFFFICWLPLYLLDTISIFLPNLYINIHIVNCLITLRHFNTLLNPYLYAYHLNGFKGSLKKHARKICKKES